MRTDIELFRIISAFGVVWFHAGLDAWRSVAYGGLVYFVIIACYFATKSQHKQNIYSRVERLCVPYLIWFAFYAILHYTVNKPVIPDHYSILSFILSSPSIHLWFLPFIFFALSAIGSMSKDIRYKKITSVFSGSCAAIFILSSPYWRELKLSVPLPQYFHAIPCVFIGVFLASCDTISRTIKASIITILLTTMSLMSYIGEQGLGVTYLIGFIPCLLLLRDTSVLNKQNYIISIANTTFGIYLFHIFWLMLLRHFGITGIILPISAFLLSLIFVWPVKMYFPNRWTKYFI